MRKPLLILTLSLSASGADPSARQLLDEAVALKKQKNFEQAKVKLEKCIKLQPEHRPCVRLLASVWASIATRDKSVPAMNKAREYYERFIVLEPEGPYSPPMGDWGGLELPPPPLVP